MRIYDNIIFNPGGGGSGGFGLFEFIFASILIIFLSIIIYGILMFIAYWKIYKKAGKPGWACIVPIYGQIVQLEICELPIWYIIFIFIPFANIYYFIITNIKMSQKFGKGTGFAIGMILAGPIFPLILAFGSSQYQPSGINNGVAQMNQQPIQNQPINTIQPIPEQTVVNQPIFCTGCGTAKTNATAFCTNCGKQ